MKLVKDTDQIGKKKNDVSDEKAEEAVRTIIIINTSSNTFPALVSVPNINVFIFCLNLLMLNAILTYYYFY